MRPTRAHFTHTQHAGSVLSGSLPKDLQLSSHDYAQIGASLHHILTFSLPDSYPYHQDIACAALDLSLLGIKILTRPQDIKPVIPELWKVRQKNGKFEANLSYETQFLRIGPVRL